MGGNQRVIARKEDNKVNLFKIPAQKPDVYKVYSVETFSRIAKIQVIEQACSDCVGDKVLVKGVFEYIINYAAENQTKSVHSVHYSVVVSTLLVLKEKAPETIFAKIVVEETEASVIDLRTIKASTVWEVVLTD